MKRLLAFPIALLLLYPASLAADEPQPTNESLQPLNHLIQQLASSTGISQEEAGTIALEVWNRLWANELPAKVTSCKLDDARKAWIVDVWAAHPLGGSGCRCVIWTTGHLEKAEYLMGV